MAVFTPSCIAIADIVRNGDTCGILPQATAKLIKDQICLDLESGFIIYLPAINVVFQRGGVNSDTAKKQMFLFRKYKIEIIDTNEDDQSFAQRLDGRELPEWDFICGPKLSTLNILSHFIAPRKDNVRITPRQIRIERSPLRVTSKARLMTTLQTKVYVPKPFDSEEKGSPRIV